MTPERFHEITARYGKLRLAVVGDFCLDRYLEINPARGETSIETGLPVHNVVNVRAQPGAAGTILNNLVALGVGELHPVGFCGEDGEGFELRRALAEMRGVHLHHFLSTPLRRTFTYCKPLVMEPNARPRELSRLDSKNWTPTPAAVSERIALSVGELRSVTDAMIVMDQVDLAGTGVISETLLRAMRAKPASFPPVIADSRRSLREFPPVIWKMNLTEMAALQKVATLTLEEAAEAAGKLAAHHRQAVFVSLSEQGILGASPDGAVHHVPTLPLRGPIDIVGAGDAVTANLITALAAGATVPEAMQFAMAAASIVVHQLGTTGTASPEDLARLLPFPEPVAIRSAAN
jgi:rfaE bifunctional protein kinase chain/domain